MEVGAERPRLQLALVDGERRDATDEGEAEGDAKLKPADIAEAYWSLYRQPRSAWTLEADLRTWVEKF